MLKKRSLLMTGVVAGLITLMAAPAFARSLSMKDAGIGLWIFIIVGAIIVLLQLIPAAILFFSFVGTTSALVFRGKKPAEETAEVEKEKLALQGYEPATVKK
jgi:hypothetical protein